MNRVRHLPTNQEPPAVDRTDWNSFGAVPNPAYSLPAKLTLHVQAIVLGLYLAVPFYKPTVQPLLALDITFVLAAVSAMMATPVALKIIFRPRTQNPAQRTFFKLWASLGIVFVLGMLRSEAPTIPVNTTLGLFATVLLPLLITLAVAHTGRPSIAQMYFVLFGVGVIVAIAGAPFLLESESLYRNTALGVNPINVAVAAMFVPTIGLAYIWKLGVWQKLMVLGMTPVALLVAMSAARGPVVATVMAFFIMLILKSRVTAAGGITLALLFLFFMPSLGTWIGQLLPQFAAQRFQDMGRLVGAMFGADQEIKGNSDNVRIELYRIAISMFEQAPILGNGTASFEQTTRLIPPIAELTHPHNLLLLFASEYGLIGLAVFVSIIVHAIKSIGRVKHTAWGFTLGVLFFSLIIEANFSNGLDNRLFWGVTFLTLALPRAGDFHIAAKREEPAKMMLWR
jgi:O-antigen ligase